MKEILLLLTLFNLHNIYAQEEKNNNAFDSCKERWRLYMPVQFTGYSIQHIPGTSDSLLLSVYIEKKYFEIPSKFLDSLRAKNRFLNNNKHIDSILKPYHKNIPLPPKSI